jgi:hypothetical protein
MTIFPFRAVAFTATIFIASGVALAAGNATETRNLADPCTQTSTGGSTSLNCGTRSVGGGGYTGGCVNAYGQYQNCIVDLLPPNWRPNRP